MIIAGIDYSIRNPSICIMDTTKPLRFNNSFVFYLSDKKKYARSFGKKIHGLLSFIDCNSNIERFHKISDWALAILKKFEVELVAIEGYSFASKGNSFIDIAENKALLKWKIFDSNIKFLEPAPSEIKKFYAGKGNANKEDMVTKFIVNENIHLHEMLDTSRLWSKPVEDIVDSFAICSWLYQK